jgi:molybdopterin-guanine dinucleotide biosynthesis protein A
MNTPIKAPLITDELIKYLESRFKDQVPDVKDSDRKVWFDAGAVSVVRHLKHIKAKQEENILNITETIT